MDAFDFSKTNRMESCWGVTVKALAGVALVIAVIHLMQDNKPSTQQEAEADIPPSPLMISVVSDTAPAEPSVADPIALAHDASDKIEEAK